MFRRLRHDAVIGRDDQQGEVDTGRSCNHLTDESLVSGDVDDTYGTPARKLETCESQLDGDAAVLLLLKTVRVGARHGQDREDSHGLYGRRSSTRSGAASSAPGVMRLRLRSGFLCHLTPRDMFHHL